jgi:hypothetical protein
MGAFLSDQHVLLVEFMVIMIITGLFEYFNTIDVSKMIDYLHMTIVCGEGGVKAKSSDH